MLLYQLTVCVCVCVCICLFSYMIFELFGTKAIFLQGKDCRGMNYCSPKFAVSCWQV